LFETGLHAMTNFAAAGENTPRSTGFSASCTFPANSSPFTQQIASEIRFGRRSLLFTNDPVLLEAEIAREFPLAH
jgi:hypothetical protein